MLGISQEDIKFLKELQHEMLTQDTVCQAAPRFWVVRGTVKEYGYDSEYDIDGCELVWDTEMVANNIKDAVKYLKDDFKEELKDKKVSIRKNGKQYEFSRNRGDEVDTIYDLDDIVSYMNNLGFDHFSIHNYRNVEKNFQDTMFLTNKECKAHIKSNYYHYPADAHSYAMTAWRAPEVEKLWSILDKINWDEVKGDLV